MWVSTKTEEAQIPCHEKWTLDLTQPQKLAPEINLGTLKETKPHTSETPRTEHLEHGIYNDQNLL